MGGGERGVEEHMKMNMEVAHSKETVVSGAHAGRRERLGPGDAEGVGRHGSRIGRGIGAAQGSEHAHICCTMGQATD